jgi:hypothetical protein
MSTSAVSSSTLSQQQQLHQYLLTRNSDLQQLGQALSQGNLSAAQTAFNNIVTLGQNGPFANGDPFFKSQREQDFNAVGQALQNGDLAGAQQAFTTLKQTWAKQQNSQTESTAGPEIVLNLSNTGTPANPEQITININPSSGGGEQLSIGVGNQGSNPQPLVNLNLAANNTNEEVVLNLLGPSSSTNGTVGGGNVNITA